MRALQKQHIVDVFVWVDDSLPKQIKPGANSVLSDSELLAILIWDGLTEPHKNLSAVYSWVEREYRDYFPRLPKYQNFVAHCHRLLPRLVWFLGSLLASNAPLRFADSTMLPVCKPIRANRHRVAKGVAAFGRNWQGWHYGFKLHAAIDHSNRLAALVFTPANEHDNQFMERLVNEHTNILVGDSHYGGSVMRKRLWKRYRTIVIAPPHHTQRKKLAADWQMLLLHVRPKIEATFGKLKEQHFLVSSFPRSVKGYFVHYLRTLLGYQVVNS
ncbi:MAG TPA: IS982 family transposase [Verrucomicrobiae bacterium]|nr:IS982 family transposase [Verrucomicrobiae bacterium]